MSDPRLKFEPILIPIEKLEASPYNPNEMTPEAFDLLKRELSKAFVGAIVVRKSPDPAKASQGFYQIIDGEHRWRASAAEEVGYKEIPCIVVEATDQEAEYMTYLRNVLHGEVNPLKLAILLENWRKIKTPAQIFRDVGLREYQQEKLLARLKPPQDKELQQTVQKLVKRTFVVTLTEEEFNKVQRALKMTRGWCTEESLLAVCEEYYHCRLREKVQKELAVSVLKELDSGKALVDVCDHYMKCDDARASLRKEVMQRYGFTPSDGAPSSHDGAADDDTDTDADADEFS